jgi:chemotaxis family two-component system response regulator PixG
LCTWVEQQKISREDAARVIRSVLTEILFDVTQMGEVVYLIKTEPLLSKQLVLIDAEQVIVETWKMWQVWQGAQLADRSPNLAPVIKQKAQLQANTSPKTYEVLFKLLDGDRTLRELAIQMKKDILQITRSLMPYIQLGFVELIEVLDLPPPIELVQPQVVKSEQDRPAKASKDYLIACIDDSPLICQAMERIITGAGYRYLSEMDGLRAIAVLLASKPDLIFLDLVMLNANGYELCAQLRKLSCFKETPIIIFTGNVNLIDRLRAKMVGCNDLLKKPLEGNVILTTIARHLEIGSSVYIASSEY